MARCLTGLAACGLLLAPAAIVAQECPEIVAVLPLQAHRVAVSGDLAVVGSYFGLSVVDVSHPDDPRELSNIELNVEGFAIGGTWLYVVALTASAREILVLDLADPTRPVQVGTLPLTYDFNSIAALGDLLHYTDHFGLHILDVSIPSAPVEVGLVPTAIYDMHGLATVDGFVYPCWWVPWIWSISWGECAIIDVTDPAQPQWLDTFRTAGSLEPRVDDGLFLAVGAVGSMSTTTSVSVHDLSDPSTPELVGHRALFGGFYDWTDAYVASDRGLLFVTSSDLQVIRVIDLRMLDDPEAPDLVQATLPAPLGMAPLGRHLLVADSELGLVVLDTTCVGGLFSDGFESGDAGAWSEVWPWLAKTVIASPGGAKQSRERRRLARRRVSRWSHSVPFADGIASSLRSSQ